MPVEAQFLLGSSRPPLSWRMRLSVLSLVLLFMLVAFAHPTTAQSVNKTSLRVLWNYPSPASDFGFSFSLDRARLDLQEVYARLGTCKKRY